MSVHAEALSETKSVAAERDAREGPAVYIEGITAGLVGASIIALWFLLIDTIAGRPFYTPAVLGAALFRDGATLTGEGTVTPSLELVLGFTWVHYLIFVLIGVAPHDSWTSRNTIRISASASCSSSPCSSSDF